MKHLKMLGLAAIAALGLMAFVGAGSASATTLFTNSNLTSPYGPGTAVKWSLMQGTSAAFTGSSGEIIDTCTGSSIEGSTVNETGTEVTENMSSTTWSGCSTTTDTIALGSISFEKTGTNEARVVGRGAAVTINIFGVSCTYGLGGGTTLGTMTGGFEPLLPIEEVGLGKVLGGFLCPPVAKLDAGYTILSPHAVFFGA